MENTKERIEEIKERIKILENGENVEEYDEMLDEVGLNKDVYSASMILKNVDEIAYNCGFTDFNDEELSDLNEKLQELKEEED
jgi:hypothetical protein